MQHDTTIPSQQSYNRHCGCASVECNVSKRFGATYEFVGWDHDALMRGCLKTVLLYRGKTRRAPSVRKREHLQGSRDAAPKPWGDLVTEFRVTWQRRRVTDLWLSVRENVGIAYKRPRYNYLMNTMNDNRVPIYAQQRERAMRDSMGGTAAIVAGIKAQQRHGTAAIFDGIRSRQLAAGWSIRGDTVLWHGPEAEGRRDAVFNSIHRKNTERIVNDEG